MKKPQDLSAARIDDFSQKKYNEKRTAVTLSKPKKPFFATIRKLKGGILR